MRAFRIAATSLFFVLVLGTGAQAITNGQPDGNRHPYAGMVFDVSADGGIAACSGVLVSPTVFLTAGHCTETFLSPPATLHVKVTFASDGRDLVAQTTGTPHTYPDFCPGCAGGWGRNLGDLGVIVLDTPVDLPRYGALPEVGAAGRLATGSPVTQVGYGLRTGVAGCSFYRCFPGDLGLRTLTRSEVLNGGLLSDAFLRSRGRGGACFADSGSPILSGDGPTVLAVDSFVNDWSCQGVDYAFRLDRSPVLSWIRSWM